MPTWLSSRISAVLKAVGGIVLMGVLSTLPAHSADDGIARLLKAYPQHLCGAEGNTLFWCDGTTMTYDDGMGIKTQRQKQENGDLQEQMEQRYPCGDQYPSPPPLDFEPGRIRYEAFFYKMYGDNVEEVQKKLATVIWLPRTTGQRMRVTTVNRIHERLQAVSDELDELPDSLKRFVNKPAGAFNWRLIAGDNRRSPHSFGIAIDINASVGDYWQWHAGPSREPSTYRNRVPIEIVSIFEKHGFIWGGKWYHYDTLHFEYRPELLIDSMEAASTQSPSPASFCKP
jgi:peptidoglycan LD-endopeptidase CwlK